MQLRTHQLFIDSCPLHGPAALQPPELVVVVAGVDGVVVPGAEVVVVTGGLGAKVLVVLAGGLGAFVLMGPPSPEMAISAQALKWNRNEGWLNHGNLTYFFQRFIPFFYLKCSCANGLQPTQHSPVTGSHAQLFPVI